MTNDKRWGETVELIPDEIYTLSSYVDLTIILCSCLQEPTWTKFRSPRPRTHPRPDHKLLRTFPACLRNSIYAPCEPAIPRTSQSNVEMRWSSELRHGLLPRIRARATGRHYYLCSFRKGRSMTTSILECHTDDRNYSVETCFADVY